MPRLRIHLALLLMSATACTRIDYGTDDDPETDTEVSLPDTVDTSVVKPSRPLCDESAGMQITVAPDLVAWRADIEASDNKFYGHLQSDPYEAMGDGDGLGTDPETHIVNRINRAWHRLRLGNTDGAIADMQVAVHEAETSFPALRGPARDFLAVCWMRKAELDNCVSNGTGEACLVPFSEEAQHQLSEGMENAGSLLHAYLQDDDPDRIVPRWLYNLSFMALGTYPDDVDPAFLVDPALMQPEAEIGEWVNIAPYAFGPGQGMRDPTLAGGAVIDDFDGDGLLDIATSSMAPDQGMHLLLNTGEGLCDGTAASGLGGIVGVLSFSQADYDNDGDLDIIAPRAAWQSDDGLIRPSLMRNDGQGHFTDVAVEAGLADLVGPTQTAVWADADNDGWLDLFVGREGRGDRNVASSMYVNRGDGTFIDVAEPFGLADPGFVKGAAWGDADNDGDMDLYVSVLGGRNRLYRNEGRPPFTEVTIPLRLGEPWPGFAAWFFDYDQDGDEDLFGAAYPGTYGSDGWTSENYGRSAEAYVSGLLGLPSNQPTAKLFRNDLTGFVDVTEAVGLDDLHATMGANFGDMNADGYADIYLGTGAPEFDALEPNTAYLSQNGGAHFADVTSGAHVGHLQKGHAVSFGDLDEDGDEDLVAQVGGAYPGDAFPDAMFMNPLEDVYAVTLRLEGVTSNRSAIGARVRVITPSRTFFHTVGETGSFGSNSLQLEIALGAETHVDRVEIDWPAGTSETVEDVKLGYVTRIREGQGIVDERPYLRMQHIHLAHDHDDE
ncbi:MAG: CRTAC1 family protein [Alphaproteobacteria bacterium]|nr:CRTAC1 family protein [Alphaproteobacteria bacterium]